MSLGILTKDENGKIRYVYMLEVSSSVVQNGSLELKNSLKNNEYRTVTENSITYKDLSSDMYYCTTSYKMEGSPTSVFVHLVNEDVQIMSQYNVTGNKVSFPAAYDIDNCSCTITYMYLVN